MSITNWDSFSLYPYEINPYSLYESILNVIGKEALIDILCPQKYPGKNNECNTHQCPIQIMNATNRKNGNTEFRNCELGKFKVTWTEYVIHNKILVKG
jgi:hypothetical protein